MELNPAQAAAVCSLVIMMTIYFAMYIDNNDYTIVYSPFKSQSFGVSVFACDYPNRSAVVLSTNTKYYNIPCNSTHNKRTRAYATSLVDSCYNVAFSLMVEDDATPGVYWENNIRTLLSILANSGRGDTAWVHLYQKRTWDMPVDALAILSPCIFISLFIYVVTKRTIISILIGGSLAALLYWAFFICYEKQDAFPYMDGLYFERRATQTVAIIYNCNYIESIANFLFTNADDIYSYNFLLDRWIDFYHGVQTYVYNPNFFQPTGNQSGGTSITFDYNHIVPSRIPFY